MTPTESHELPSPIDFSASMSRLISVHPLALLGIKETIELLAATAQDPHKKPARVHEAVAALVRNDVNFTCTISEGTRQAIYLLADVLDGTEHKTGLEYKIGRLTEHEYRGGTELRDALRAIARRIAT